MCSVVAEFIALKPYSNGVRNHARLRWRDLLYTLYIYISLMTVIHKQSSVLLFQLVRSVKKPWQT